MANQGAKKLKQENEKRLRFLFLLITVANAIFILGRMVIFWNTFTWKHWVALGITSTAYWICYGQLSYMAKPEYDEKGELVHGGYDLGMGGMAEYLLDILYVTAFVQVFSVLSDYFWLIYLVIPAFGAYMLWTNVLHPYFFSGEAEDLPESEKERRRREKMEKKAARPKFMKSKYR